MFKTLIRFLRRYRFWQYLDEYKVALCTNAAPGAAGFVAPSTGSDGTPIRPLDEDTAAQRWLLFVEVTAAPADAWSFVLVHTGYLGASWFVLAPNDGKLNDGEPLSGTGPRRFAIGVRNIALLDRYAIYPLESAGTYTVTAYLRPCDENASY